MKEDPHRDAERGLWESVGASPSERRDHVTDRVIAFLQADHVH